MRSRTRSLLAVLVFLGGTALALPEDPPDVSAPLPDPKTFLEEVRKVIHSDNYLLDEYTFTETSIEQQFDRKGAVKKVTREIHEVYPSAEPGHTYRKLVERNGTPLSEKELAKQDHKQEAKLAREEALGEVEREKRMAAKREKARQREEEIVGELFRVYDISILGRELIEGATAILLEFRPRPDVKPTQRAGKILKKFYGRAWVDEEEKQVVRAELQLIENFSLGLGVLVRLQKGAKASFLRRKVNDEIWLPAEARFTGTGRLLLVKGLRVDALSRYSDYRKFHVATESRIEPPASGDP